MSALFSLKIVASDKVFFDGKCQMAVLPALDGEKGIMAHHEEMVMAVETGSMRYQMEDGTWQIAVVSKGFADVANNRVTVLVYSAEKPEDIDAKRAQEARERAEEQLRQKQSIQEYHISQAALARALARLKEAGKIHPTGY